MNTNRHESHWDTFGLLFSTGLLLVGVFLIWAAQSFQNVWTSLLFGLVGVGATMLGMVGFMVEIRDAINRRRGGS